MKCLHFYAKYNRILGTLLCILLLSSCAKNGGGPVGPSPDDELAAQDDVDISTVPDAVPVNEPLSSTGNNPYRIFGVDYLLLSSSQAYIEEEQADNIFKVKSGPYVDADQVLQHKLEIGRLLNLEARDVFE